MSVSALVPTVARYPQGRERAVRSVYIRKGMKMQFDLLQAALCFSVLLFSSWVRQGCCHTQSANMFSHMISSGITSFFFGGGGVSECDPNCRQAHSARDPGESVAGEVIIQTPFPWGPKNNIAMRCDGVVV
jgi:hypothetical protein